MIRDANLQINIEEGMKLHPFGPGLRPVLECVAHFGTLPIFLIYEKAQGPKGRHSPVQVAGLSKKRPLLIFYTLLF